MPFGCFKKEKAVKSKDKPKKGAKNEEEKTKVEAQEAQGVAPQEELIVAKEKTPRSPRKSPRARKQSKVAKTEEAPATPQTNRENLISSESSVPGGTTTPERGAESRTSTPKSAAGAKLKTPRTAASPVSELPLQKAVVRMEKGGPDSARSTPEERSRAPIRGADDAEPVHPASARVVRTHHAADSTPVTPHFFSPRVQMRRMSGFSRTSVTSRGRTSSISNNDWSKIQRETDQAVASQRTRIFERKMTLAADMEAQLDELKKSEAAAKRESTELDLNELDGLNLDGDEVALAKFKEEDYDEAALEEKILEEKIVQHLEQDVLEAKKAVDALQDDSSSMDLDDLDALNEAIPSLDDSQDLDGLDLPDSGLNGILSGGDDSDSDSATPPTKPTNDSISPQSTPRALMSINLKEKPTPRKLQRSPSASSESSPRSNDNASTHSSSSSGPRDADIKISKKKRSKRSNKDQVVSSSESHTSTPPSPSDKIKRNKTNSNHAMDSATEETHTERQISDNDLSTSASVNGQALAVDPVA